MKGLRIISDVHGKYIPYAKIARRAEEEGCATLQLGDFGFSYGSFEHFELSPNKHRFFAGNHDNYEKIGDCPNNLGDFGEVTLGGVTFFFVRGAYSIDRVFRVQGRDWWSEEELSMDKCYQALEQYRLDKPDIVISHDCPDVMRDWLIRHDAGMIGCKPIATRTGQLLQAMYDAHQPERWIFGHWHINVKTIIGRTEFICLGELSTMTIEGG